MPVRSARLGFTLIELLVVLTVLGVLGGAMGMLLTRQQRFYRGAGELLYARESVRDALEVLANDIRSISTADTVRLLADSALEMFSSIGSSVVCQVTDATQAGLPAGSASGNTLTALPTQPDTGDLALFYRDSIVDGSWWERHRIAAFTARSLSTVCPPSTGFSTPDNVAAGEEGFQLTLESPLNDVRAGAPVRFVRRGRYSLYRASDGEWYLGYRRCNALGISVCGAIQPLSGPYRPYSGNRSATGILFEYFDAEGARVSPSSPLTLRRARQNPFAVNTRR